MSPVSSLYRVFPAGCLALLVCLAGCSEPEPYAVEAGQTNAPLDDRSAVSSDPVESARRPNILLVVADDLGFTDLGVYGSEIDTPTLDALARGGVTFGDFHAAPTCSPTRAQLLTGRDNHLVGLGVMAESLSPNKGRPGYEGYLDTEVTILPQMLSKAGYQTLMVGKWHLGYEPDQQPAERGFDRSFALLGGGSHHLENLSVYGPALTGSSKARYVEDGRPVDVPADFYSTRYFTDRMIEFIDDGLGSEKPFFAYLTYTAPHWPLQAPDSSIARYKGRYDVGYDVLREQRITRMKTLGNVAEDIHYLSPPTGEVTPWEALSAEQQLVEAKKMEIYAAMVSDLDIQLGRLVEYLKSIDQFDNTLLVFISDNGPAKSSEASFPPILQQWYDACCQTQYENMGQAGSWVFYGIPWATAGAGYLRGVKGHVSEGGTRVPAIVHYPEGRLPPHSVNELTTVMDLAPTFLEIAGLTQIQDARQQRLQGESLWPALLGQGRAHQLDYTVGWEFEGTGALRQGDWKLLLETAPYGEMNYQLYNLRTDPGEVHDLSSADPDRFSHMLGLWESYKRENGVLESPSPAL